MQDTMAMMAMYSLVLGEAGLMDLITAPVM